VGEVIAIVTLPKGGAVENTAPSFGGATGIPFHKPPFAGLRFVPWLCFILTAMTGKRPDQNGTHRGAFEKNKRRIYSTQSICGICGLPVDFSVKYPHPLSPCIDHKIPVSKGGHPSDMQNLQLAHWICNRQKSDKLAIVKEEKQKEEVGNFTLPWSLDWERYRA